MPSFAKATKGILLSPLGAAQNGDDRDRTCNLRLAKPALSQLSYVPGPTSLKIEDLRLKILKAYTSPDSKVIQSSFFNVQSTNGPGKSRTSDLALIRRTL